MTVIAEKHIPSVDWPKWMKSFSAGVTNKTYNKMDYQLWKKCNRTGEAVNIALTDLPSIRLTIGDRPIEVFGTCDKSFGTFLFNHMFSEEERTMSTYSNVTLNSVSEKASAPFSSKNIAIEKRFAFVPCNAANNGVCPV